MTAPRETRFVGNRKRPRWAMLRADWPPEKCGIWMSMPLGTNDARILARAANVSLAALYLPDPTRREMLKAWAYGTRSRLLTRKEK